VRAYILIIDFRLPIIVMILRYYYQVRDNFGSKEALHGELSKMINNFSNVLPESIFID